MKDQIPFGYQNFKESEFNKFLKSVCRKTIVVCPRGYLSLCNYSFMSSKQYNETILADASRGINWCHSLDSIRDTDSKSPSPSDNP